MKTTVTPHEYAKLNNLKIAAVYAKMKKLETCIIDGKKCIVIESLQNMTVIELQELEANIKRKIIEKNKNSTFWNEIKIQKDLIQKQQNIEVQINQFIESSNKLKKIKNIGYSIIFYHDEKLGLLKYSKDKTDDKYYGFEYSIEGGITKTREDVTNEDLEEIKKILEL